MKSLIWKEWQENLKWAVLPSLLILGFVVLGGTPPLLDVVFLFYVSLVAALFGAVLGFLQVFFESQGDKRALLLHRPLSRSRIFLGKALAGVTLYLLALGLPCACIVALAATPGHVDEPFGWVLVLPLLADVLTGLVYYFAGMLTAQREARWYGSRCLGLAAGLFCSILVWALPEFWHALVAIGIVGGLAALAAWGSFSAGGAYAPQPRLARIALAVTLLLGLSTVAFVGKFLLGVWMVGNTRFVYHLDRQGQVMVIHWAGQLGVTDLEGQIPRELQGVRLDDYALEEVQAPAAEAGRPPRIRSYRNQNRFLVKHGNRSRPGNESWWYVPAEGRLVGYEKHTHRFIGSFGPDGFVPPDEQPGGRFPGELVAHSLGYRAWAPDHLVFPGGVYQVDFRRGRLQTLFVPGAGESVTWASRWEDDSQKSSLVFVGTNQSIHVVDEAGSRVCSLPLASDLQNHRVERVGRLENPQRYWVWYAPLWYQRPGALQTISSHLVVHDCLGQEMTRQAVPPRQGYFTFFIQPLAGLHLLPPGEVWLHLAGLVTPLAEAAVLTGTTQGFVSEVRANNGAEQPLLLWLLMVTQVFIPGLFGDLQAPAGVVIGHAAGMLLSALVCALVCFLLARRHSFSPARCIGWTLCGFVWGPTGLLLLLALQDWPARVTCPGCGKLRLVTRDTCEHCGAAHAPPAPDGTEIFEETAATPLAAGAGR
jgi:hypothetical protein